MARFLLLKFEPPSPRISPVQADKDDGGGKAPSGSSRGNASARKTAAMRKRDAEHHVTH